MTWQSQAGQDAWVVDMLDSKRGGYFVDVGAHDGLSTSNTVVLEQLYGWTGLAIEAEPSLIPRLRDNRTCDVVHAAVTDRFGPVRFAGDRIVEQGGTVVPGDTLTSILVSYQAPTIIDYLSIDIEGGEIAALLGLDFGMFHVKLLTVEHNLYLVGSGPKEVIHTILTGRGYRRVVEDVVAPGYGPYEDWYAAADVV